MMVVIRRSYSLTRWATVLVIHALILYLLLLERPNPEKATAARYSHLLFIVAAPPKLAPIAPEPPRIPVLKKKPAKSVISRALAGMETPPPVEMASPASQADPFSETRQLNIDSLVKQAGKADREAGRKRKCRHMVPRATPWKR